METSQRNWVFKLLLGTLNKDDDDGIENVGKKNDFEFFQA